MILARGVCSARRVVPTYSLRWRCGRQDLTLNGVKRSLPDTHGEGVKSDDIINRAFANRFFTRMPLEVRR